MEPRIRVWYDNSMKTNSLRVKAEKMRDSGYSYNMIDAELNVAKSTLSNWFKDRPFIPNPQVIKRIQYGPIRSAEKSHNKKVQEIEELKEVGAKEIGCLDKRGLWLLGLGLYIGEGTKTYENTRIINSDPNVIKLSLRWFKEICGLSNNNITVTLHLYPDNNRKKSIKFWQQVTSLPLKNFRKIQIDTRNNKSILKRHKLPFGTAHLNIICGENHNHGVRLHRRIMGWISGIYSQV